ncbi:hypothetical protein H109_05407 [Trichophyton interdigitale MR816]|uniref:Uncharacterized protein n=1 Tax=Trichophyton interdigitale (strain MR816) TaxID=1215338 RepID=A0A059J5E0_TRIIM|nr:hypothetical protein H101_04422 [Trichophyton interdigitale H6]KDB22667.1 hypothetical protein H109_05407 [Trichophyton interdigitale MR816]
MSICLPRRILLGHSCFQARRHVFYPPLTPYRLSLGIIQSPSPSTWRNYAHRSKDSSKRKPYPIPPAGLRKDPSEWIKSLEIYIPPRNVDNGLAAAGPIGRKSWQEDSKAILELLYQAREQLGFDLLTILGLKLGRWRDFHLIFNKLFDFASESRALARPGELPSNIDWSSLGSFDRLSGDHLKTTSLSELRVDTDGRDALSVKDYLEGAMLQHQTGKADRRAEAMSEILQSLGSFILEASDLPEAESASVMSHFHLVVAQLHHLDMIPSGVYKYDSNYDPTLPNRPPEMQLLSYPIMSVVSGVALEAAAADNAIDGPESDSTPFAPLSKFKSRPLGFGIWLEFILWCCVEGGYAAEASWILQMSRSRSKAWNIQSWAALHQSKGPIDPLKMDRYDTWEECGVLSDEPFSYRSDRPFLGMGERTITKEVVYSVMEGLINSLKTDAGTPSGPGDPLKFVLTRLGLLRALLGRNKLSLSQEELTYLIVRILETGAVVPETDPQSLEHLLNHASYILPAEHSINPPVAGYENVSLPEYKPAESLVVLGLYQYALNIYASSGRASGTIDIFGRLLGEVDPAKVFEMRESVLDPKYLVMAHRVHQTASSRSRIAQSPAQSERLELPPVSWALLLDTLTSSRLYRLADWVTHTCAKALEVSTSRTREGFLITDSLVRLATATKNRELYSNTIKRLERPLRRQTLIALLNWRIGECDSKGAVELLRYLRDIRLSQWDIENITSLAAVIIRLECQPSSSDQSSSDFIPAENQDEALELACSLLVDLLNGKFNQHYSYAKDPNISKAILNRLHHVFRSVPGRLSNACRKVQLQWDRRYDPEYRIPPSAFNHLLAAVVDTQGCLPGKRLWDQFCIDPLLSFDASRDRKQQKIRTDLPFNARSIYPKRTPLVVPDLTTVRIIANAALDEQKSPRQSGHNPAYPVVQPLTSQKHSADNVNRVLDWCVRVYERLGLDFREINRELDGHPARKLGHLTETPLSTAKRMPEQTPAS